MRLHSLGKRTSSTFGKLAGQHLVAQVAGRSQSRLLYVWDHNSGHKLLADTGAQVSISPASTQEHRMQRSDPLIAANGSTTDTFNRRTIPLDLGF